MAQWGKILARGNVEDKRDDPMPIRFTRQEIRAIRRAPAGQIPRFVDQQNAVKNPYLRQNTTGSSVFRKR